MKPMRLDYQRAFRPFPWFGLLLLFATLPIIALLAREYMDFSREFASWEDKAKQAERVARKYDGVGKVSVQDKEQLAREVKRANEILQRIALPWDDLFGVVEAAMSKNIALLALEPDGEKQVLKIVGEAKDLAAMFEFMHKLEGSPLVRSVTLQTHQVQLQDAQRPIRYTLAAAWQEAGK